MSRAVAALAPAFGLWLVTVPFTLSLFACTDAAEKVTNEFRPVLSRGGVAQLDRNYPAIARGLARWPAIRPGAADLAARQRATVAAFRTGDGLPFRTLPWLIIAPAALLALLALAVLVVGQRRPDAVGEAPVVSA
ncbi:MAG TPA: hypothetical protein VH231_21675 [Solirubrobacteraceae bacterium]|jgi:hypothetical protein|nr:hypothetical protein [Solirubrobacteraceae bacterium]